MQERRKSKPKYNDINQSKSGWTFLAFMAEFHKPALILTPSLFILSVFLGIFLVMNVGYNKSTGGFSIIPRINIDVNIKKGVEKL